MDSTINDNLTAAKALVAVAANLEAAPSADLTEVNAKIESLQDQLQKATHLAARRTLIETDQGDRRGLGLTPAQWKDRFADLGSRFNTALGQPNKSENLGKIIHETIAAIKALESEERGDGLVLVSLRSAISEAWKYAKSDAFKNDVATMQVRAKELKKEPSEERCVRGDANMQLKDMVRSYLPFDPAVECPDIGAKLERQTELITDLRAKTDGDPSLSRAYNMGEYSPEYDDELRALNTEIRALTVSRLKVLLPTVSW